MQVLTRVVLNPDKFTERTLDFAGFRITESTIEPLAKYLDAIREFPTPTPTTDMSSCFGLVNQVGSYAQLRDLMAPFKPFLSPKMNFYWNELEAAFQNSKRAIISAIKDGVEIFDIQRRTCLRPAFSRSGIGYFLLQQHCQSANALHKYDNAGFELTIT